MHFQDQVTLKGHVLIFKNDVLVWEGPNTVVAAGKTWVASRIAKSPSPAPLDMDYMAIGTGNTGTLLTDTTLDVEVARVSIPASVSSANQAIFVGTFDAGVGTGALVEAGIFDSASGGLLLARHVFPVVNKEAGDYITVYWAIQVL